MIHVGRMNECGHCQPTKYSCADPCPCCCHGEPTVEPTYPQDIPLDSCQCCAELRSELAAARRMIHPWYGPCDGIANGECSECDRLSKMQNGDDRMIVLRRELDAANARARDAEALAKMNGDDAQRFARQNHEECLRIDHDQRRVLLELTRELSDAQARIQQIVEYVRSEHNMPDVLFEIERIAGQEKK